MKKGIYYIIFNSKYLNKILNVFYRGTVLGSSRGGFDAKKIVDSLVKRGIN
jgi:hypothetical protein